MRCFLKEEKDWFRENKIYICLLCLNTAIFSLLYFNRFAPDTMGWQLYNAILMEDGKMVYRDFFNYLPPGSLIRTIWAYALTDGSILGYRAICIIERVFLCFMVFKLLSKYFPSKYAWISCITGTILTATTVIDQFGDYNQTYKVYLLIGIYFGTVFFEHIGKRKFENICLLLTGISLGMVMLYKQSIGVIAPACFFLMLIIYCVIEKNKSFLRYTIYSIIGYLLPTGACSIWLAANKAFIPFIEQVFKSAAAKGDSGVLVFRFWLNILQQDCIVIMLSILVLILIKKYKTNTMCIRTTAEEIKKGYLLNILYVVISIYTIFLIYQSYGSYLGKFLIAVSDTGLFYLFGAIIISVILIYLSYKKIFSKFGRDKELIFACSIGLLFFLVIYIVSCISPDKISALYWNSDFFGAKEDLPIYSAYIIIGELAVSFLYYIIRKKTLNSFGYMLMLLGFFSIIYEGGMATGTDGLTFIIASISIPYAICLMFQYKTKHNDIKNMTIIAFCICLCLLSTSQKFTQPYSWWGWNDTPIGQNDQYSIDVNRMEGFRVPYKTKEVYEETVRLITDNSDEEDFVLTFPHMKLFNILADRMNAPTFVVSYYFDVCPDEYAIADAEIIKNSPPKIVIMNEYSEEFWNYNENAFRKGEPSGQRKILEWFENSKSNYSLIGRIKGLEIYRIIDGTPINYTYFENDEQEILATGHDSSFSILEIILTQLRVHEDAFDHAKKALGICIMFILLILMSCCKDNYYYLSLLIISGIGICFRITSLYFLICIIPLLMNSKRYRKTEGMLLKATRLILWFMLGLSVIGIITSSFWIKYVSIFLLILFFIISTILGIKSAFKLLAKENKYTRNYTAIILGTCLIFLFTQIIFTQTPWWKNYCIPYLTNYQSLQLFGLLSILLAGISLVAVYTKKKGNKND